MSEGRECSIKNGTLTKWTSNPEIHQVVFYRLASGREPVREWLRKLDSVCRKRIGRDLYTLQLGWPLGMPLARKIEAGLWELRSKLPIGISRIMFTEKKKKLVLLHGFIKKAQKTPASDLTLARSRLNVVNQGKSYE